MPGPAATRIALLRGINVGGNRSVAMADLRDLLTALGFEDVRSLLNTGNLVFKSKKSAGTIEKVLEAEVENRLGLRTDFMVRTAVELDEIVGANPFPKEAQRDPARLIVMFCKTAPPKKVKASGIKRETFEVIGREIYIVYPDGQGESRLRFDAVGTGRNWNTVLKLVAATRD